MRLPRANKIYIRVYLFLIVSIVIVGIGIYSFAPRKEAVELRRKVEERQRMLEEERRRKDVEQGRTESGPPQWQSHIDQILAALGQANIAFNAPSAMNVKEISTIQLLLSVTHSIEELKKKILARGEIEATNIKISDLMEARLSGTGFQIEALTHEIQPYPQRRKPNGDGKLRRRALATIPSL
jgi:hypothetical protein